MALNLPHVTWIFFNQFFQFLPFLQDIGVFFFCSTMVCKNKIIEGIEIILSFSIGNIFCVCPVHINKISDANKLKNIIIVDPMSQRTKPIQKGQKVNKKGTKKPKKPITNEEGNPIIQHLNDFITSVKTVHTDKPIYTGGRIITMYKNIYACCNNQISVYNLGKEQITQTIKHKNEEIANFAVCPHEKYIITYTNNFLIRVLLLQTRKIIFTMKVQGLFANCIEFSPTGKHVAFAFGGLVHIYTFQSQNLKRIQHYYPSRTKSKFVITKLQWHPDPNAFTIITADLQRKITVFDSYINKIIAETQEGEGGNNFALTPKGTSIASINNLEIKIFQTKSLKLQYCINLPEYMQGIHISGNTVYFGGEDTELYSVNLDKPGQPKVHKNCTDNGIMKIMSYGYEKAKKLMVLSAEQNITVLKFNSDNEPIFEKMIIGYNDEIIDFKYSKTDPKQCNYLVMVTNSNNVKVINRHTYKVQYLIKGHTNTVLCCDYMHPYVLTAGKDNQMKLWKIEEEKKRVRQIGNYQGHSADILSVCLLKESKTIATVSDDKTLKLWPLCSDSNQQVQIKSSLHTTSAHAKSINAVRVSPKEDIIATCSQDRTIKIWTPELMLVMTLNGHKRGVWDASFHDVEKLLVSVAGDGMLKGWNLITGQCMWSMGEGAPLMRCSFIYYNQVVTGSSDGMIKIWDIRKQTSLSYDKHEGKIWALDVLREEGNTHSVEIISGAADSVFHVWRDNTKDMRQEIMLMDEKEQMQKINYAQYMHEKKYSQAALVAFKSDHKQLFINVMEKIISPFDAECKVKFENDELMIDEKEQEQYRMGDEEFSELVTKLKQINLQKLFLILQAMNSTVRHYKMANKVLRQILRQTSISELMSFRNSFSMPSEGNESIHDFNEKKTDLQKWLIYMIGNDEKHISRVQKYMRGTYWTQHLYKLQNPLG